MPTYRSITLSLVSQFDILIIPEYPPPAVAIDPFSTNPQLIDTTRSIVSTYIPMYPSSQFWFAYSIAPPYPPNALYYFKLYINGVEVVSWGCGEDEDFKGKTMFALSAAGQLRGRTVWERRTLSFGKSEGPSKGQGVGKYAMEDMMEIRVFRSRGRKRIVPDAHPLPKALTAASPNTKSAGMAGKGTKQHVKENGIDLLDAGLLPQNYPQRFYHYALLDPLDTPFAIFRYFYRSIDELYSLGVIPRSPSLSSQSSRSTLQSEAPNVDAEEPTPHSAQHSYYSSDESDITLSSPQQSPLYYNPTLYSSAELDRQQRMQQPEFSSPLSKISEEGSSFDSALARGSTICSPQRTSGSVTTRHIRTDSSPLRIPRLQPRPESPVGLSSTSVELDMLARPPTPPLKSSIENRRPSLVMQRELPPTPGTTTANTATRSSKSRPLLRSPSSKESFATIIRERLPSPDMAKLQLRDELQTGARKQNEQLAAAGKTGSRIANSLSVGALRKVFERSLANGRNKEM